MSESLDGLLEQLGEMLEPGESLLENAFSLLRFLVGSDQVVTNLLTTLGVNVEVCVFDTNQFLNDIKYTLKKQRQTAVPLGAKLGGVKFFASVNVRDEMPRKIKEKIPEWGLDAQEALHLWKTEYAPWMRFVDPSEMPLASDRLRALEQRDRSDLQTGQLIELVHPHAVLSSDADLASFETMSQCSAIVTCAYRAKGKREVLVLYFNATGVLALRVTAAALYSLIALLCRADKRILLGTLFSLVVVGGASWLYTPSRIWLQKQFRSVKPHMQAVLRQTWEGLQETMEDYERLKRAAETAKSEITASRRITEPPRTAREYVSRILANAAGPLSVAEISRIMQNKGYVPRGAHPEIYLRGVLRAHPGVFERDGNKRWSIKRHQAM